MNKLALMVILIGVASALYYPASSPVFTYSGRRYLVDTSIAFDWQCFRIAFCFKNVAQVQWHIRDIWNKYSVVVDKETSFKVEPGKNDTITIFNSTNL